MNEKTLLRARDFWTSIVLMVISLFFLLKTAEIPFWAAQSAGVDAGGWYNSAALVPYGIFIAIFVLALCLLVVSIQDGGAKHALSLVGLGYSNQEALRLGCISIILFFYIFGLVPRVDFILSSALMITALIWGFHRGQRFCMVVSACTVAVVSLYAMLAHFPRSQWAKPHDDDWLTLVAFIGLTFFMFVRGRKNGELDRIAKITPIISILVPLILVLAMAFGFRQNVPNRTGLVFSKIEYHYYVSLRPLWQGKK